MSTSSKIQHRKNLLSGKDMAIGMSITFAICTLPTAFMMFCWSMTKFPPQIFGNNEDHFRAHVIDPIPESVKILDVEFDDIIIHPDVAYYFRFSVNRTDLEGIIFHNSLKPSTEDCLQSYSYTPKWWNVSSNDNMEVYKYDNPESLKLILCYDISSQIAYYRFWTY
jgi:hypothetical protein